MIVADRTIDFGPHVPVSVLNGRAIKEPDVGDGIPVGTSVCDQFLHASDLGGGRCQFTDLPIETFLLSSRINLTERIRSTLVWNL